VSDNHADSHGAATHEAATPPWGAIKWKMFLAAIVGAGMLVGGFILRPMLDKSDDLAQFFSSYLVGFIFWLSLPVGSLLLLSVQYLAGGRWGINIRRILEANTKTLPLLMLLFIPVGVSFFMKGELTDKDTPLENGKSIYWWANLAGMPEAPHGEEWKQLPESSPWIQLARKSGRPIQAVEEASHKMHDYLNPQFAIVRAVAIFAIWGILIWFLLRWGQKFEDTGEFKFYQRCRQYAGFFAMIFALVTTFAATDWVMSLEETWYSTMFPVIFATNTFLTTMAFSIIVFLALQTNGYMPHKHTKQDQINLASFMLAFTLFWSYTSFSQFLLIWSGNLPEEIPYYLKRSREGWQGAITALAIFHFACPFVLLLFRNIKEHPKRLTRVAIMLLFVCALDVFLWIEPTRSHDGQWVFWIMSAGAIIGIGGLWGWLFIHHLSKRPLMPIHEGKWLEEDHHHGAH
jgi:hypothetical protein